MGTEKRLIDANVTTDVFTKWLTSTYDGRMPGDVVAEIPTVDAVEVVRCKDCKYRKKQVCANPSAGMWVGVELRENDYCSCGERKTE